MQLVNTTSILSYLYQPATSTSASSYLPTTSLYLTYHLYLIPPTGYVRGGTSSAHDFLIPDLDRNRGA